MCCILLQVHYILVYVIRRLTMECVFFSPGKGYFCIPVREGNIARAYVGCRSMKRVGTGGSQFISMLASVTLCDNHLHIHLHLGI